LWQSLVMPGSIGSGVVILLVPVVAVGGADVVVIEGAWEVDVGGKPKFSSTQ
jgi:hypothetical protein